MTVSRLTPWTADFEPSDGVAFALGLLNSWDELEPDPECLRDVGVLRRFLTRHGLTDAARVARDADVESLRSLRGRLAHAWDAADEQTAVAELNTILSGASAQPWLARRDGRSRFRYDRPGFADPGVRRRARRPRRCSRRSPPAAGRGSAAATPSPAAASSSTGRGAACAATAAGSAPTGRRTRRSEAAAARAPNFVVRHIVRAI